MKILINTDKNILGTEEMRKPVEASIEHAFDRFSDYITRIEVKISDENADKNTALDKRCVMEARLRGMEPLAVTSRGDSVEHAVDEAIDKMKTSLDSAIGRLRNH